MLVCSFSIDYRLSPSLSLAPSDSFIVSDMLIEYLEKPEDPKDTNEGLSGMRRVALLRFFVHSTPGDHTSHMSDVRLGYSDIVLHCSDAKQIMSYETGFFVLTLFLKHPVALCSDPTSGTSLSFQIPSYFLLPFSWHSWWEYAFLRSPSLRFLLIDLGAGDVFLS